LISARRRELVTGCSRQLVGAVAAVPLVTVAVLARGRKLGLLVTRLGTGLGRRCGRGLARGVVDRDRDPDRAAALAAQGLADDGRQAAFEYALREFVRYGEQSRVRYQRERLTATDPVLVLRLDALAAALPEELLQYAWPHCGKIGRYVSHRARSLTGPTNGWFWDGSGCKSGGAGIRERIGVPSR
jgi:hypothetical protein